MSTSRWLLLVAILAVAGVNALVWLDVGGSSPRLDCGPEGKPTLDGRACIDRHPVTIP